MSNQQIQEVQQMINHVSQNLTTARDKLMNLQLPDLYVSQQGSNDLYKKNIELIESSKSQLHVIIDQYFKDLSGNYIFMQSKYPSRDVQQLIIKQIDQTFKELSEYQTKLQNNSFTMQDYSYFNSSNFLQVKLEVIEETNRLSHTNDNQFPSHGEENMPYVKVENKVIEGLYLGLNQYASVQWPGETPKDIHDKLNIDTPSYFTGGITFIPVIDEAEGSITVYDVNTHQVHQSKADVSHVPNSFTQMQSPSGEMWLSGGLTGESIQGSLFHIDVERLQVTRKADMLVKRVGHGSCYHDGYIYVIGGKTENHVRTRLCERYNIQNNTWEMIEKMPEARSRGVVVLIDDFIYVFFGTSSDQQTLHSTDRYSISKGTWQPVFIQNFLPGYEFTYGSGVVVNAHQVLLFGGIRDSIYFKNHLYSNRKLLLFNTHNDTYFSYINSPKRITVLDSYLPIDLIPLSPPIVHNNTVYTVGSFMSSGQTMWMNGAFVLQISDKGASIKEYVDTRLKSA